MTTEKVSRGEIWTVQLSGVGHEQQGSRPSLIISEDALNHSGFRLIIAIPITSNVDRKLRTRVRLDPPEGGLDHPSAIMCEQILRLDIEGRLLSKLGTIRPSTMVKVERVLALLLGIIEPEYC